MRHEEWVRDQNWSLTDVESGRKHKTSETWPGLPAHTSVTLLLSASFLCASLSLSLPCHLQNNSQLSLWPFNQILVPTQAGDDLDECAGTNKTSFWSHLIPQRLSTVSLCWLGYEHRSWVRLHKAASFLIYTELQARRLKRHGRWQDVRITGAEATIKRGEGTAQLEATYSCRGKTWPCSFSWQSDPLWDQLTTAHEVNTHLPCDFAANHAS